MDADRQEDIAYQIGQSKAQRNAIAKAMPEWLVDQAIEEAKASELSKIKPENIHLARAKVLSFFFQYGVTQDRIEAERTRTADQWTAQDIVDLRGMATGLKEGRVSADSLFPPIEAKDEKPEEPTKDKKKANGKISAEQAKEIDAKLKEFSVPMSSFKRAFGLDNITDLPAARFDEFQVWLNGEVDKRNA